MVADAKKALDEYGAGLSSVRFICGTQVGGLHREGGGEGGGGGGGGGRGGGRGEEGGEGEGGGGGEGGREGGRKEGNIVMVIIIHIF